MGEIEVAFGLGGPAEAPVVHRFGPDTQRSANPSGEFYLAGCGVEVIPFKGEPKPDAARCPRCEYAASVAACPTPIYHETHRYCPSCPWTELGPLTRQEGDDFAVVSGHMETPSQATVRDLQAETHLLRQERDDARARLADVEELSEMAWGIIANAGGGDWGNEHPDWRGAAERWRDRWHALIASPKPTETH